MRWWNRFFFEPRSASPAALVRIGWGFLVSVWALTLLPDVDPFLTTGALRYDLLRSDGSWNAMDLVDWSGAPLTACVLLLVFGLLTVVGWHATCSSIISLVLLVSLQRTNSITLNSGDLLIRIVGLGVILSPCGWVLSLDERRRRRHGRLVGPSPPRSPHGLRLLQLLVATGYFMSFWLKVQGNAWPDGTAVGYALRIEDLQRFTPPEWLFSSGAVISLLTWGTLAFEASFMFLVWNRRLRPWVLGAGIAFHMGIDLWLDVGFFSWAIYVAYLAFLPPEVADQVVGWLRRRLPGGADGAISDGDADDRAIPAAPPPLADHAAGGDPLPR